MATSRLNRRRFLTISACALGFPQPGAGRQTVAHWRGVAMGAEASLSLAGVTQGDAVSLFLEIEAELLRLENIFSLYRAESALSRLNRDQILAAPPLELIELLGLVDQVHKTTQGAFDPTVQPLWALYAASAIADRSPQEHELATTLKRTGWRNVRFGTHEVSFATQGMALTLNGIAQGFVTDQITTLLRRRGFSNVLVNIGEISAIGQRPGGGKWQVGIASPDGALLREIPLSDRAVATSAPMGTVLDQAGRVGHIIDPRNGSTVKANRSITISAPSAALADGLSTACCVLQKPEVLETLTHWQGAALEFFGEGT